MGKHLGANFISPLPVKAISLLLSSFQEALVMLGTASPLPPKSPRLRGSSLLMSQMCSHAELCSASSVS